MSVEISKEDKIREELAIDDSNLEGELKRQAGRYFYWGTLQARAAGKVRGTKAFLDTLKAEKGKAFKDNAAANVRVTERMLDDYLDMEPDVQAAKQTLIDAQYEEQMLDTAVEAFKQRHYAIVELLKAKDSERAVQSEFNQIKKDYEERERRKMATK